MILTEEIKATICQGIEAGNVLLDAIRGAGISKRTYYRWMNGGKAKDARPEYRAFRKAVQASLRVARSVLVLRVREASTDDWRAAAFLLERRYPKLFGKKTATELSGPNGGPISTSAKVVILPAYGADDEKPLD